jgi:hypothetical protein
MIVVAAVGLLTTLIRVPTTAALIAIAAFLLGPPSIACLLVIFTPRSRYLLAATWVAASWPLSIPWTLNAAWGVANGFLGYSRPVSADNTRVLDSLTGSVLISFVLSFISTNVCLSLLLYDYVTDDPTSGGSRWINRSISILLMFMAWCTAWVVLTWDPFNAVDWFVREVE